jgi:hypothetical protein
MSAIATKSAEAYMREVRQRLAEIDRELENRCSEEKHYKATDRENRIILNTAMAKISAQLNSKKDASKNIETLEGLCSGLSQPNTKTHHHNDPYYHALTARLRFELEEWSAPVTNFPEKKLEKLMELLGFAKKYDRACLLTGDLQLKRDACKKLIGVYMDIQSCPYGNSEEKAESASLEKLLLYTEKEIDERESKDPMWMRQYCKARCGQVLDRHKKLRHEVSRPEEGTGAREGLSPVSRTSRAPSSVANNA